MAVKGAQLHTVASPAGVSKPFDLPRIERAVREILVAIGDDPDRAGLRETPRRVADMYAEVFSGLHKDASEVLTLLPAEERHDEMVMVRDIPVYSMCEHHLLPFFGRAHVSYIPRGRLTGLSKLARAVDALAMRPQVQERLTRDLADILMRQLQPQGVMVLVECEHLCMIMRGVRKPGALTVTSAVRGTFRSNPLTRSEALEHFRRETHTLA
jgi:GTP cyclohydrolase I